ncbi:MAG: hypothetical protein IJD49_08465 [Clostridia bacterium]|nr:hypothetical protein [Clostridia bacterium]
MKKRVLAVLLLSSIALSITSCKIDKNIDFSGDTTAQSTQKETRIHNSFKDVLPDFGFDSVPLENYREGVSYSFSAQCSEKDYEKYIDAVKKTGFNVNSTEANGYYSAYTEDDYFAEITLVDGMITVFVKR